MSVYESKPTQIEAIQWDGRNKIQLMSWAPVTFTDIDMGPCHLEAGRDGESGIVDVPVGTWIARNVGDPTDYWPINDEHFRAKYSKKQWADE